MNSLKKIRWHSEPTWTAKMFDENKALKNEVQILEAGLKEIAKGETYDAQDHVETAKQTLGEKDKKEPSEG